VTLALLALAVAVASAFAAGLLARRGLLAFRVGTLGVLGAAALGLVGGLRALRAGALDDLRAPWPLPVGAAHVGIDALSAFFLVCLSLVSAIAALHGLGAVPARGGAKPGRPARLAGAFALTLAGMIGVVLARDGVLFLVAWEVMTIASFFLVGHDEGRPEVRRAAMAYLVVSHGGAAALWILFALLAGHAGDYGFDAALAAGPMAPALAGTAFGLAAAGFGAKAALFPLHVWAPDAYPAAPPHAAALLSGAVSKMGVYGLVRVLTLLGPPAASWGRALIAIGIATALAGAVNAFAERDLRRLVACSSIENLGVVAVGLGIGLLGRAEGAPAVALLGFAGALLHVLNHGVLKSLLFLLAGDVEDRTGTRRLDRLGGLARRMPVTAGLFLLAAVGISGLPPLNGFVSEWLVLVAGVRGAVGLPAASAVFAILAVAALGLAGALAAAAYVKAFGVAFLGAPRTEAGADATDPVGPARQAALGAAAIAVALGLAPAAGAALALDAAGLAAGVVVPVGATLASLAAVGRVGWVLLLLVATLAGLRLRLLARRDVRAGPVWGCGYEAPSARMQYTAGGFPEPAIGLLGGFLARSVARAGPTGLFPDGARYTERRTDAAGERLVLPLVRRFVDALGRVKVIQAGRLQLYLLYVLATLVALLAWQLLLP
jgi:hydrogenase-4 component B